MKIDLTPEGLNVTEIPDNPLIAFGLLKMAEISVTNHFALQNAEKSRITPAVMLPPGMSPRR